MARAVLICRRHAGARVPAEHAATRLGDDGDAVRHLLETLRPDNAPSGLIDVEQVPQVTLGISGATATVARRGVSACLGHLRDATTAWDRPGAALPEGAHAVMRADHERVELVVDAVASRTVWYVLTDEAFFAATSQRVLVALLGGFERDPATVLWMLSSGLLGPERSWDRRLRIVPPGTRLTLDRHTWALRVVTPPIEFRAQGSPRDAQARLDEVVTSTLGQVEFDPATWVLPLSGGYDSRGLLTFSNTHRPLRCLTWGRRAALDEPGSDATVARALAAQVGARFEYRSTDLPETESTDVLLTRFLVSGEGRSDLISGYMDGFAIWRSLADDGIHGIVRGDEGFGGHYADDALGVRRSLALIRAADTTNLPALLGDHSDVQVFPAHLERDAGETLAQWRDRLFHGFRLPIYLAALTDLKLAYVEVANPLLATSIVEVVRTLPDELRTEKRAWRNLVERRGPPVPFATHAAILWPQRFMRAAPMVALLRRNLDELDRLALPGALRLYLERELVPPHEQPAAAPPRRSMRHAFWRLVPVRIRSRLRPTTSPPVTVDPYVLGLRALIAARMLRMLDGDARLLAARPRG